MHLSIVLCQGHVELIYSALILEHGFTIIYAEHIMHLELMYNNQVWFRNLTMPESAIAQCLPVVIL